MQLLADIGVRISALHEVLLRGNAIGSGHGCLNLSYAYMWVVTCVIVCRSCVLFGSMCKGLGMASDGFRATLLPV